MCVIAMTGAMIVKDFAWIIAYWPNFDMNPEYVIFCNVFELIYAAGSLASTAFSNLIVISVVMLVSSKQALYIEKYFAGATVTIIIGSILLAFVLIPAMGNTYG